MAKNHVKKPDEVGEYHLLHVDIVLLSLLYCGYDSEYALTRALEVMRVTLQSYRDGLREEIVKNKGPYQHLTYHLLFGDEENPKYREEDLLRMLYDRIRYSGKFNLKALWVEQNSPFLVVQKLFKIHKKLREDIAAELPYEHKPFKIDKLRTLEASITMWERISNIDLRKRTIVQRLGVKREILNEVNEDFNIFINQDVANDCYMCEFVRGNAFEINCNECLLFPKGEKCKNSNEYTRWLSTGSRWHALDILYKLERILKRNTGWQHCEDALFVDALADFYMRHERDEFIYFGSKSFEDMKCVKKYLESFGHRARLRMDAENYFLHVTLRKRIR